MGRNRIQEGPIKQREKGMTSWKDKMMGAKMEPHLIYSEKSLWLKLMVYIKEK